MLSSSKVWTMNTFKAEVYKIILGLTLVGLLILLIFPASLSANHFRAGTMSWENPWDNRTIRLNMTNGWTADHDWIPNTVGALNSAVCDWEDCTDFTVKVFGETARMTSLISKFYQ